MVNLKEEHEDYRKFFNDSKYRQKIKQEDMRNRISLRLPENRVGASIKVINIFDNLLSIFGSSTLDWTTPMREVIVKSMKVGVFLCQEREEHLPLNLNYRWSDYLKMVNQNLKLYGSMISRLQL